MQQATTAPAERAVAAPAKSNPATDNIFDLYRFDASPAAPRRLPSWLTKSKAATAKAPREPRPKAAATKPHQQSKPSTADSAAPAAAEDGDPLCLWSPAESAPPGSSLEELTKRADPPVDARSLQLFPDCLRDSLMPFQRASVQWALQRAGRVLIGDDMGLQRASAPDYVPRASALTVPRPYSSWCQSLPNWPALVIAPSSVALVWADELEKWIPMLAPGEVNVIAKGADAASLEDPSIKFHIVSYGLIGKKNSPVAVKAATRRFQLIVVDESHYVKNREAKRTAAVLELLQQAERRILLSGTPALSRPCELYTQVSAVAPNLLGSWRGYTDRYCAARQMPWGRDVTGASRLPELHKLLVGVMIRRRKKDVLQQLPAKRRQRVVVQLPATQLDKLGQLRQELDSCEVREEKFSIMMKLHQESAAAKQTVVGEYVSQLVQHSEGKFLLFAHHRGMLDAITETVQKAKVGWMRIDGSTNQEARRAAVHQFQTDDSCRVAVLSILAAGVGITLTAASTVVFAEMHWTPGSLQQAEDRAHRIGQHSAVNVHYLCAPGRHSAEGLWQASVLSEMLDGMVVELEFELPDSSQQLHDAESLGAGSPVCSRFFPEDSNQQPPISTMQQAENSKQRAANTSQQASPTSKQQAENSNTEGSQCSPNKLQVPSSSLDAAVVHTVPVAPAAEGAATIWFCVSRATGRVHLYDADKQQLGVNLAAIDAVLVKHDSPLLHHLTGNAQLAAEVATFGREWKDLRACDRRQLTQKLVQPPLAATLKKQGKKARTSPAKKKRKRSGKEDDHSPCVESNLGNAGPQTSLRVDDPVEHEITEVDLTQELDTQDLHDVIVID